MTDLTPAQLRVVSLAVMGLSNSEIADLLSYRLQTVKNVLTDVYRALGIRNRRELVLAVMAWREMAG